MKKPLFDALENCLKALEKGETIEVAINRFPEFKEELRPLLESARAIRILGRAGAREKAPAHSRVRILSVAADLQSRPPRRPFFSSSWRLRVIVLALLIFILLAGNGLLLASAQSLPGDVLYPIKRSMETTQLNLTTDPGEKKQLQIQFSQRRIQETQSLITIGRVAQVQFDGVVTSKTTNGWVVNGIPVVVTAQTHLGDEIKVGDDIRVFGETHIDGSVGALSLGPKPVEGAFPYNKPTLPGNPTSTGANSPHSGARATETPGPTGDSKDSHDARKTQDPHRYPGFTPRSSSTPGDNNPYQWYDGWWRMHSTDEFHDSGSPTPTQSYHWGGGH